MISPLIVALDYASDREALALAAQLDPAVCRVKVGKELFTMAGPAIVVSLQRMGFEVFLDLKFHDIPQTVAKACKAAARLGVWMLNVHASGGRAMLLAAREAVASTEGRPPLLIAVTVLTSLDDAALHEIGVSGSARDQVRRLAALAAACALDGVVCSAQEAMELREVFPGLLRVTPGIRLAGGGARRPAAYHDPRGGAGGRVGFSGGGQTCHGRGGPGTGPAPDIGRIGGASCRF